MDHIVIKREIGGQKEYGTIKVEFLEECWQEVWCDSGQRDKQNITSPINLNVAHLNHS